MQGQLFTLLPPPRSRWKSFVTGWGVQAVSFFCLFLVSARFHQTLVPAKDYRVTNLVSYEPVVLPEQPVPHVMARAKPVPANKPAPETKPAAESKPAVEALVVTRQVRATPSRKFQDPEPAAPAPKLDAKLPVIPAGPTSQVIAVGTFSHESPVTAPVARMAPVQSAGFGTAVGNGAGHGSGAGGGGATPGVVASAGFGNGAISSIKSAGFVAKTEPRNGVTTPVEVTFKPRPDYTDEGRKQRINGEVRLEVLFKSDGRIHVVRVLQGLGYGLDEQAVKAAEQIKFKPALREGQPVDSTAMVHIIFELIS